MNTYTTILLPPDGPKSGACATDTTVAATPELAAAARFESHPTDRVCLVVEHGTTGKARFTHAFRAIEPPPVPLVRVVQA